MPTTREGKSANPQQRTTPTECKASRSDTQQCGNSPVAMSENSPLSNLDLNADTPINQQTSTSQPRTDTNSNNGGIDNPNPSNSATQGGTDQLKIKCNST